MSVDGAPYTRLFTSHPRRWRDFSYIYPVLSRRSKGLSLGVNLNPDRVCNWDCVYCQVDRSTPPPRRDMDLSRLRDELDWMLGWASDGAVWEDEQFRQVPPGLRRVNDIAFSGDGEPTTYPRFDEAVQIAADLKAAHRLPEVKLICLTNMTMAHREVVKRGFAIMDAHNGEVWAKLEAGTQEYYDLVDRSPVKLGRILDNIRDTGRVRPIVIQSMFMRLHGEPIPAPEFGAYLDRLAELLAAGCRIKLVQIYTIARGTAETYATPLTHTELDALAGRLRVRLPRLAYEVVPGTGD